MKSLDQLKLPDSIEVATPRWQEGLVLLCSKCSGEQHGQPAPDPMPSMTTWELRNWLKDRLLESGVWPSLRVQTTSCMGICRPGKITCAMGSDVGGGKAARCLVVDPAEHKEVLLAAIEDSLREV